MDLRDLEIIKGLFEKESELTDKEEIVKEKVDTLLAFEETNKEYNNKRKEFQDHMEELNKKAGE